MTERPAPRAIAQAFIAACEAELRAPKPGNVHIFADGHGMAAQDFRDSAVAAAPFIAAPDKSVGEKILGATQATWGAVAQNTNLGIVLLCAPLAAAIVDAGDGDLRAAAARILARLDTSDADAAFRAITLAQPAGLGDAPEHDVTAPARTTLLEAMRAASDRDRVAFQYANDFVDIFETGLPTLATARARGRDADWATLTLYLAFLTAFPDSHVARKYGPEAALALRDEARAFTTRFEAAPTRDAAFALALDWDRSLKERRLNPGTSADLTVAALFTENLAAILAKPLKNG